MGSQPILDNRKDFIVQKGRKRQAVKCESESAAGCVSQRACVYCGARVVLNPVADALHLVHGPIGCASYTMDIRGSLNSGVDLYRNSFSTDLKETDIIFGGEKRLAASLDELISEYKPPLAFVYSTCVVGVIGDDLEAVCKKASADHGIPVIPVQSSGFIGSKSAGYKAACDVLFRLIEPSRPRKVGSKPSTLNYLGDYNLAGEAWIIRKYLEQIGVTVQVVFTGDSRYEQIRQAANSDLNIIQCAGSMFYLAGMLEEAYGIPYMPVSFLGIDDTANSLRSIARHFKDEVMLQKAEELIARETSRIMPEIFKYRQRLAGKRAAVYVGGGFKAVSLIKQFRELGMEVVMIGTQTGRKEEYETMDSLVQEGAVILDDANPAELERFMLDQGADLLVGGVKERPLAYKLGIAFVDHNHDRKHPLSGFEGAVEFAAEVYSTIGSPVWQAVKRGIKHG